MNKDDKVYKITGEGWGWGGGIYKDIKIGIAALSLTSDNTLVVAWWDQDLTT